MCCIYAITNLQTGQRYIGGTVKFSRRKTDHLCNLRKGTHSNHHLQQAWNKYGEGSFVFYVLSVVDSGNEFLSLEQAWLDGYKPEYNIALDSSAPMLGRRHTGEALARVRTAPLGLKRSDETKQRMSESIKRYWSTRTRIGRPHTEEFKEKMRARFLGIPKSEEHKRNMRKAFEERKRKLQEKICE